MSRRLLSMVLVSAAVTLASSFAIASYALGSGERPRLRPELPAAQLPTFSLDEATSLRINNIIGTAGIERFGITADSYAQVRRLANTRAGTFYLIPGSRGACIVSSSAASCGDPGAPGDAMLGFAQATPENDVLVGAGIATATTQRVALRRGDGSRVAGLPLARGVFVLNERAGVTPNTAVDLQFDAN